MESLLEAVKSRLRDKYRDEPEAKRALALIDEVGSWNAEGGKQFIESKIKERAKSIEIRVSGDIEKLKSILEEEY